MLRVIGGSLRTGLSRSVGLGWLLNVSITSAGLVGCSSDAPPAPDTSAVGSESGEETVNPGPSSTPGASSTEETTSNPDAPQPSGGVIEPGTPVTLADGLVFGSRLCVGSDDRLYFPNRLGYPTTPGLEELWSVSKAGGDAQRVASPGSSTGCIAIHDEVWVSANVGNSAFRLNVDTKLEGVVAFSEGTPLQMTSNGTFVFASISGGQLGGNVVVSIDPSTLTATHTLWSKSGSVVSTWLRSQGNDLIFSVNDGSTQSAWIVHVNTESRQSQDLVSTTGEVGGIDIADETVYYAHHDRGEVRKVSLMDAADSLLANVEGAWSLLVDGDSLYVGARPDFCAGGEGKLYRVPLTGGDPTLLADQLDCPSQLLADERGLYWINNGTWPGPESPEDAPADSSVLFLPRQ